MYVPIDLTLTRPMPTKAANSVTPTAAPTAAPRTAKGFWYLGSPYSKYPLGLEQAFREVCRCAAVFVREGIPVYSPIAHTHPIAMEGRLDPLDHTIWLAFDAPMMAAAEGLIVCEMQGWQESEGLKKEIEFFESRDRPVTFFDPVLQRILPGWR